MPKLKFKYRKTVKMAEFVHADLEYHEHAAKDAKESFKDEVSVLLAKLAPEDRKALNQEPEAAEVPTIHSNIQNDEIEINECFSLVLHETGEETQEIGEASKTRKKSEELKKLFRRIAAETHPDKVAASGFSDKEVSKKGRIFKKAREAFNNNNWFMLHSIAIDLDIKMPEPSEQQIQWIEEDIAQVRHKISNIQNLTAWHWHHGNELQKAAAMRHYFQQVYNFIHPELG